MTERTDPWVADYLREKNAEREERIRQTMSKAMSQPCKSCGVSGLMAETGKTSFACGGCRTEFRIKRKYVPKKPVDPTDSTKWKAKCSECGGTMDYHDLRYVCRKCGEILEV